MAAARGAYNSVPPTSPGPGIGIYGLPGPALFQVHEEGRVQFQHVAPDSWGWRVRNAVLTAGIGLKAASMERRPGGESRQERGCSEMDTHTHAHCVQAHVRRRPAGILCCSCSLFSTSVHVSFPVLSAAWIIFNKYAFTTILETPGRAIRTETQHFHEKPTPYHLRFYTGSQM